MIRVVFHTCGILHDILRIIIPIAQRSLYIHVINIAKECAIPSSYYSTLATWQISHVNDIFFHFTSREDIILHSTTEKFG